MPPPVKPPALQRAATIRIVATSSPVEEARLHRGCGEIERLGYVPCWDPRVLAQQGFFAGSTEERVAKLASAFEETSSEAVFCARGGYGVNYLLDLLETRRLKSAKILLGYSDVTSLQAFLWRKRRWVTLYGPMVATGLDAGPGASSGYDPVSISQALTETHRGCALDLRGDVLSAGAAA